MGLRPEEGTTLMSVLGLHTQGYTHTHTQTHVTFLGQSDPQFEGPWLS